MAPRSPGAPRQTVAARRSADAAPPQATDDQALLAAALADVTPLPPPNKARIPKPRPAPLPRQRLADDLDALSASLAEPDEHLLLDAGPEESFARPGVSRRTLADLRRGRWVAEAVLDLHGLKRDEARRAIDGFLDDCQARRRRVVRIIHGRGLGSPGGISILRLLSRHWLLGRRGVLAYCQARRQDGGEGALQVLLRSGD
jgi:DNA-nicking Smr family endonuclease